LATASLVGAPSNTPPSLSYTATAVLGGAGDIPLLPPPQTTVGINSTSLPSAGAGNTAIKTSSAGDATSMANSRRPSVDIICEVERDGPRSAPRPPGSKLPLEREHMSHLFPGKHPRHHHNNSPNNHVNPTTTPTPVSSSLSSTHSSTGLPVPPAASSVSGSLKGGATDHLKHSRSEKMSSSSPGHRAYTTSSCEPSSVGSLSSSNSSTKSSSSSIASKVEAVRKKINFAGSSHAGSSSASGGFDLVGDIMSGMKINVKKD